MRNASSPDHCEINYDYSLHCKRNCYPYLSLTVEFEQCCWKPHLHRDMMKKSLLYPLFWSMAVMSEDTEVIPVERFINDIPIYSDDEEDKRSSKNSLPPPGVYATPDDQGDYPTCTRHALAKAIVDGLMKEIFLRNHQIDFDQDEVTNALKREHNDNDAIWPTDLHMKTYKIKERNKDKYWNIRLHVNKLEPKQIKHFVADIKKKVPSNTYILVHQLTEKESHCLYVDQVKEIEGRDHAFCINSHTSDPKPHIYLYKNRNIFYQIWCTIVDEGRHQYIPKPIKIVELVDEEELATDKDFVNKIENSPIHSNGFGSAWSSMSHGIDSTINNQNESKKKIKPKSRPFTMSKSNTSAKDPHELINELKRVIFKVHKVIIIKSIK